MFTCFETRLKQSHKALFCCGLFILAGLVAGCQGYSITGGPGQTVPIPARVGSSDTRQLVKVHSLYIAPLQSDRSVEIAQAQKEILGAATARIAREILDLEVLAPTEESQKTLQSEVGDAVNQHELGKLIAQAPADAICQVYLTQYIDRKGSRLAADVSARIAFRLELLKSGSGQKIWAGDYYFNDHALSDNLLELGKGKGSAKEDAKRGWLTAPELYQRGIRELMVKFQQERLKGFIH